MSGRSLPNRTTLSEVSSLINEIRHHADDCEWVAQNIDMLFEVFARAIYFQQIAVTAIEFLNKAFPCIIVRDDYRRWEPILFEALTHAQNLKDSEFQMQLWAELGQNYLQFGMRREAYEAFSMTSEHGEDSKSPEMALLGKLGQLKTHAFFDRGYFNDLVKDVLKLARQIDEPSVYGRAHSTLALAYALRGETEKGLGHGLTAYAWWHHLHNPAECADVALTMAETCRWASRIEQADRFLNLAEELLRNTNHSHKLAVLAYNKGIWYLAQKKNFEDAENWLQIALNNFNRLDFPYLTNAAYHAIALAQIRLGKYKEASDNLRIALVKWRQLRNQYEVANASHALGFLYFHQQNHEKARRWYDRAIKLCEKIPDSPLSQALVRNVGEDLSKLNDTG